MTFENVPAFALHLNVPVEVPNLGTIKVDIAWGGMMYVLLRGLAGRAESDSGLSYCVKYGEMVKAPPLKHTSVHP